jgi:hypothetical protein
VAREAEAREGGGGGRRTETPRALPSRSREDALRTTNETRKAAEVQGGRVDASEGRLARASWDLARSLAGRWVREVVGGELAPTDRDVEAVRCALVGEPDPVAAFEAVLRGHRFTGRNDAPERRAVVYVFASPTRYSALRAIGQSVAANERAAERTAKATAKAPRPVANSPTAEPVEVRSLAEWDPEFWTRIGSGPRVHRKTY